jgi:hypothetical protein
MGKESVTVCVCVLNSVDKMQDQAQSGYTNYTIRKDTQYVSKAALQNLSRLAPAPSYHHRSPLSLVSDTPCNNNITSVERVGSTWGERGRTRLE